MRHKNMAAQLDLAIRRGQLISKDLVAPSQASFSDGEVCASGCSTYPVPRPQAGWTRCQWHERKALREIAISTLNELKDLPSAVSDPDWLAKVEKDAESSK